MTAVYTVREVADLLRLSPQTVYRAIDAGQLPAVRLMGVVRVPVAALDALTQPHVLASATSTDAVPSPATEPASVELGAAGAPVASRGAASSGKSASRSSTAPTCGVATPTRAALLAARPEQAIPAVAAPTTQQRPDVSASGLHDNAAVMTRQNGA